MSVGKGVDWVVDTAIIELAGLVRLAAKLADRVLNRAVPMDEAAARRHSGAQWSPWDDDAKPVDPMQPQNPIYRDLVERYLATTETSAPAHSPEAVEPDCPEPDASATSAGSGHPTPTSRLLHHAASKIERLAAERQGEVDARLFEFATELRDRAWRFRSIGD